MRFYSTTVRFIALAAALALASAPAFAQSAVTAIAGAQTCATTIQPLPSNNFANGVVLTADPANTGKIYIGPSTVTTSGSTQGYPLAAGASISYNVSRGVMVGKINIYMICANGTDVLHYTGN